MVKAVLDVGSSLTTFTEASFKTFIWNAKGIKFFLAPEEVNNRFQRDRPQKQIGYREYTSDVPVVL